MNLQLHEILSNPALLTDVSDDTLQSWIQQYPYVSLFHLYALKRKNKYSESELHKTAFYFNNREKLYFLLNNKNAESTISIANEKINTVPPPIETKQTAAEELTADKQEKVEPIVLEEILIIPEEKREVESIEEAIKETTIVEHHEQEIAIIQEPKSHEEVVSKNEISTTEIEESKTEEITIEDLSANRHEEIKSPFEEEVETVIPVLPIDEKPLSIADQILLEIQQIKEERALKANQTEIIEETLTTERLEKIEAENSIEIPAIETTEEKIEPVIEPTIEEEKTAATEKPLSIQDEVINRINKIKEERFLKMEEEKNLPPIINIETKPEIPVLENTDITKEEIKAIKTEPTEKPLSIQDEIIARIQKIKEERAQKVAEENKLTPINEEEKEADIKIVEKEIIIEEIDTTTTTDEYEKEIELVETKIQEEINQFTTPFPEPLLVTVDASQLKDEKTVFTAEQLKEEIIVPIEAILENKTIQTEAVKEILEEKLHDLSAEIVENAPLISSTSDLFIPNVAEDTIEKRNESENESDLQEKSESKLDDETIKEPHTFVEWLKLLDGKLQIQTSETATETENWIEIPRYEIEQAIANKKEIQKEEQQLFVPNFEEGEVDLFNEIDEEVSKVASESVSFKQDMMTETLAKIYMKQGKTDKALEIYNTLLLKFPKKRAYFAGLIKKIEKEK